MSTLKKDLFDIAKTKSEEKVMHSYLLWMLIEGNEDDKNPEHNGETLESIFENRLLVECYSLLKFLIESERRALEVVRLKKGTNRLEVDYNTLRLAIISCSLSGSTTMLKAVLKRYRNLIVGGPVKCQH